MALRARWINTDKDRIQRQDKFWNDKNKKFAIAVGASFVLIQLLFLGTLSYLYGAVYQDSTRVHNFNFLLVDHDGGVIGESLRRASKSLAGSTFPTVHEKPRSQYPTQEDVSHAVWSGEYWGAIMSNTGASSRLSAALEGGWASQTYNANDTLVYVYNEARYASMESGSIVGNLQKLISVTHLIYNKMNGTGALTTLNTTSPQAVQALLNPIAATAINLKPAPQGTRVLYNTVSMVMPIVMQFFFLMAVNSVAGQFKLYSHLPLLDNAIIRFILSTAYTFIGALCHVTYQYAFLESDWLSSGQFAQYWMAIWLYMHINFLFIDCLTAFLPMAMLTFFFFPWVIFNTTSIVIPFELNPAFYRWGYALPAHEVLQVLITIWSSGGVDQLNVSLPILFAWETLLLPLSVVALRVRCAHAAQEFKDNEKAMRKKYGYHHDAERATRKNDVEVVVTDQEAPCEQGATTPNASLSTPGNGFFPNASAPFQEAIERVLSNRSSEQ